MQVKYSVVKTASCNANFHDPAGTIVICRDINFAYAILAVRELDYKSTNCSCKIEVKDYEEYND